mgnify:CR=1 FL=1
MTHAIDVQKLTLKHGDRLIQKNISFTVEAGDICVIIGASGCGKSTLLRNMLGLETPTTGDVSYNGASFIHGTAEQRRLMRRGWGVTFQQGGLISAMTLAENLSLPLELHTKLPMRQRRELIDLKLSLVGLAGYEDFYPSELSGGMRKRAALARALMLNPEFLFFDEPSAGLDPISSRRLDELISTLATSLGATVVMVTHELDSIFSIATRAVYLDNESRTLLDAGPPQILRDHSEHRVVREFLNRGVVRPDRGQKDQPPDEPSL